MSFQFFASDKLCGNMIHIPQQELTGKYASQNYQKIKTNFLGQVFRVLTVPVLLRL